MVSSVSTSLSRKIFQCRLSFGLLLGIEVEGNFQFHEDDIVVQLLFRRGLWPVLFSAFLHDQTIEKSGKLQITELLIGRVIVFFQPVDGGIFGATMVHYSMQIYKYGNKQRTPGTIY